MRLLSFLPGKILYSIPYTKDLFFQVGELVALTDLALMVKIELIHLNQLHLLIIQEFAHNGIKGIDRIWNLNAVPKLSDFAYVIKDEQKHKLAMEVVDNFKTNVLPHLQKLESGPIHGDFNEQNILGLLVVLLSNSSYTNQ